jgi:hypothetical protein
VFGSPHVGNANRTALIDAPTIMLAPPLTA